MKLFLLSCALTTSGWISAQFNDPTDRGTQTGLFQDLAPIKHDGYPIPLYNKAITFSCQNKWALSNVNVFKINFQSSSRRGMHSATLGLFSHPGCHIYSFYGKESVRIGKNTALGLRYGARYLQWLNEDSSKIIEMGISYTITKDKFYLQCNSVLPVTLIKEKQQPLSPQWFGVISIQFHSEVALQIQTQFAPNGLNFVDTYLLWKYNSQWSVSLGTSLPMGGWKWGIVYWLPKRQQGFTFDQSAWVRPSLGYWIRMTS